MWKKNLSFRWTVDELAEVLAEGQWSRCPEPQWTEEQIYVHEDPSNMYLCILLWNYAEKWIPPLAVKYTHTHLPEPLWKMAYITSTDVGVNLLCICLTLSPFKKQK